MADEQGLARRASVGLTPSGQFRTGRHKKILKTRYTSGWISAK
jgi:hypothetical protein